ncbi:MAG: hypothetical protein H0V68_06675 [Actinobacteria bacterium]|nr:hypothetical protein [Actinomycetota bacterium]
MEHPSLGRNGIEVSRIILGCGNFGGIGSSPAFFGAGETVAQAHALMDAARAAGSTTFDTADAPTGGWLIGKYRRGEPPPAGSRMTLRPAPYLHLQREGV